MYDFRRARGDLCTHIVLRLFPPFCDLNLPEQQPPELALMPSPLVAMPSGMILMLMSQQPTGMAADVSTTIREYREQHPVTAEEFATLRKEYKGQILQRMDQMTHDALS